MRGSLTIAATIVVATGCVRDPDKEVCPQLANGALAITEVRKATSSDTLASWVELYNTTGDAIGMRGVELRFRNPTGSSEIDVTVRRDFDLAPGTYATFGLVSDDDTMRPAYIDYGFLDEFSGTFPSDIALEVDACGTKIDLVTYSSLPGMGTYSLGTQPPSADDNDFSKNWCTDGTLVSGGYPGTPQQANIACPPATP